MDKALVTAEYAPIFPEAGGNAAQIDEALHGDIVTVLEAPSGEWCPMQTEAGLKGYMNTAALSLNTATAENWAAYGKMAARAPWVDVLTAPESNAPRIASVPRGALLHPTSAADENGWMAVETAGGQRGYSKQGNLMPYGTHWQAVPQEQLREAIATSALSYLGTQYRWGGRTQLGIDAGGLCAMAYRLNGCLISQSTAFEEGGALHKTTREKLAMGDIIYFKNHAAIYLGDDKFVHATSYNSSDSVVINTLDSASPFFRDDLAESILVYASLF